MFREPNLRKAIQKYPNKEWKNLYEETLRSIDKSNHTTDEEESFIGPQYQITVEQEI